MRGLSPKLPLTRDFEFGYSMNKTYKSMIKQNIKMLLLTAPGEKIMDPDFGVGLKTYFFEQNNVETQGEIESKISTQINKYMPFVSIVNINFENIDTNEELDDNFLRIRLEYTVKSIKLIDKIDLGFDLGKELVI